MTEKHSCDCGLIGLSGTTAVVIVRTAEGYEARMGIALFGSTNMDQEQMRAAEFDPFHPDWHDNYVSGKGETREAVLEDLKKDSEEMHESLWI